MKFNLIILIFVIGWCGIQEACGQPAEPSDNPPWQPIGRYRHSPIRESSGVVASQQFEGVYWTLNDSGNPPVLYATTLEGKFIREFTVQGAANRDWEALALDDQGQIWVGDIGNNSRMRDDLKIYVMPEPDPFHDSEAKAIAQYPYRYPDENVDAEGLFILDGFPYIVSKEPERAILYRFATLQADKIHTLERVGELADARLVTGADLSLDGKRLAICTYDATWVYQNDAADISQLISDRPWMVTHDFGGEAVVFDGYNLVLTTEPRDIYRLPQWWYEEQLSLPPRDIRSAFDLLPTTETHGAELQTESYQSAGINIGGKHIVLPATQPESEISQIIEVPYADQYEVRAVLTCGPEYAQVALVVDGNTVGQSHDCYAASPIAGSLITLGTTPLEAGKNRLTFRVVGKSPDAKGYKLGIDSYLVRPNSSFATRYMVLGPFPKAALNDIDEPLPPEQSLNLKGTFQGLGGKPITWKEAVVGVDGQLDLCTQVGNPEMAVAYALTYVYSEEDREATLRIGSNDQVAAWINGEEVHRHNVQRWAVPDQDSAPCRLQAGWNEVLCKVGQNRYEWILYLRFTDPDGSLKYASQPTP